MTSSAGRTLGRYRLERLVGRGGMAEVWEARDQTLGRRVAIKIIAPDLATDARFHERFLSEARSVAALEHANVLPIYDFGESDGVPYLVMPFLESGTLSDRAKQGEVPVAQAIDWIRQLAAALDAAHAAGVLHRDVKPANVMIGAGGRLLLADFGIAKSMQSGNLTATGLALGTPAYMAPELARGESATPASDRYALGVLAYELLCGRPPEEIARAAAATPAAGGPDAPTLAAATPWRRVESAPTGPAATAAPRRTATLVAGALIVIALGVVILWWATRQPPSPAASLSAEGSGAGAVAASDDSERSTQEAEQGAHNGEAKASGARTAPGIEPAPGTGLANENERPNEGVSAPPPAVANAVPGSRIESESTAGSSDEEARTAKEPTDAATGSSERAGAVEEAVATEPDIATAAGAPGPGRLGQGQWAVPPAEAFAIFDRVGDAWRRGRFRPGLFTELEPLVASLRRSAGASPGVELIEGWVAGGQALIAGDREAARETVRSFFAIQHPPEWSTLLPARFLVRHQGRPSDWQVALFWGDPRGEARALVEEALRGAANDRNLLLARAVLEHLDGRHAEAAGQAKALDPLARGPARVVLARFTGDQLLWSGEVAPAISWSKRLLVAPDRTEIAAVLRTLSEEGGPPLVARACTEGFQPACEAGRPHPAQRVRRARQQP
jgi:eukaryotic-like serine/threonine-protein kinase